MARSAQSLGILRVQNSLGTASGEEASATRAWHCASRAQARSGGRRRRLAVTSQGRGLGAWVQGVPGSRRPPRPAFCRHRRHARQHRKAAASSPRPAPSPGPGPGGVHAARR